MRRSLISRTLGARSAPGSHQQKTIRTNTTIYQHVSTTLPPDRRRPAWAAARTPIEAARTGRHSPRPICQQSSDVRLAEAWIAAATSLPNRCKPQISAAATQFERNSRFKRSISPPQSKGQSTEFTLINHQLIEQPFIADEFPTPEFIE
jgi:hypothetical protein